MFHSEYLERLYALLNLAFAIMMIIPLAINARENDRKMMKNLTFICIADMYRPISPMIINKGANRFFEEAIIIMLTTAIAIRMIVKAVSMF